MGLIIILSLILIGIVIVQIAKITELAGSLRGEEEAMMDSNRRNGAYMIIFLVGFLIFCVASAWYYQNWMLGYGPHTAASEHGVALDGLFNTTLIFTGIVFFITQILLFWYSYKFQYKPGRKSLFLSHDNTLEIFWTAIPAAVMCFLVVKGLIVWNDTMADTNDEYIEIEAMGQQFNWLIRYPGEDNLLGERNYKLFTATNPFGQDWNDRKNHDDFHPAEIVLPKGKKVRVRITAKDVLHNFDLPHFRVKMDAIPGLPTYFVFTPTTTTAEYRARLKEVPEYQALSDELDPESPPLWEAFNYELACAELCGKGHYSMKRIVKIVEQEEYDRWVEEQNAQAWYENNVKGSAEDPFKALNAEEARLLELEDRKKNLMESIDSAISAEEADKRMFNLENVNFKTGSAVLEEDSSFELDNVVEAMKKYPKLKLELAGHTDNIGNPANNLSLSTERAKSVYTYLVNSGVQGNRLTSKGYGDTQPTATNDNEEGRRKNRRTEARIISN
jgi:cytochrome c oxidase subunit 2